MNNGSLEINYKKFTGAIFYKKSDYFSEFIKNNESVNLILGSSTIRDAIIPDSLGPKWFSFTNGGQNVYESYKFIDYYKDSLTIDTIIIGIQPSDFPYSYIINREHNQPALNGHFHIFGRSAIVFF